MTMMKTVFRGVLISGIFMLTSCASKPDVPENIGEAFVLERDLIGKTVARGGFSAIDGTEREFVAYIDGTWDGEVVTLVEDFEYTDGVKETKTWKLTKLSNGEWSGVREDVVGTARGYQDGAAFRLEYDMALPDEEGNPGRKMRFRDIIVNDDEGSIINNATVGMFGFRVATVNLVMTREEETTESESDPE